MIRLTFSIFLVLLSSSSLAKGFIEIAYDPDFTVVREKEESTESIEHYFGDSFIARAGYQFSKYSLFALFNQNKTKYKLDTLVKVNKTNSYGAGITYNYLEFFESGIILSSFKNSNSSRSEDRKGFNLDLYSNAKWIFTPRFFLSISVTYTLKSKVNNYSESKFHNRSLYFGIGSFF